MIKSEIELPANVKVDLPSIWDGQPVRGKRETIKKPKALSLPLDPDRWKYKGRSVRPGSVAANRRRRT